MSMRQPSGFEAFALLAQVNADPDHPIRDETWEAGRDQAIADHEAEYDAETAAEARYFDMIERSDEIRGFHDGPPDPPDYY